MEYIWSIKQSGLFNGISEPEIEAMAICLGARTQIYRKDSYILRFGDAPKAVGLVLSGSVLIVQEDYWGNRNIREQLMASQVFAEAFACMPGVMMDVSVVANEDCRILWLDVSRILNTCSATCAHHARLIRNLLADLAASTLRVNEKLTHISKRTTREKLFSYLSSEARKHNSPSFSIPFNRQQLADYLSVERSAMSAELSRMQNEGLLRFSGNGFCLLQEAAENDR